MVLVSWESMWTVALDSTGNHCQGWWGAVQRYGGDECNFFSPRGNGILLTQPGIKPRPPRREPTPSAPFLPNSTATNPNGSSRDGMRAKSAPLNRYGGKDVNSGFENTRSG